MPVDAARRRGPARVVLVAGASSGIGRAAARALVDRGHRVFGTARDADRVRDPGVEPLALDVTDPRSVADCAGRVVDRAGSIDALVYSAGFYVAGAAEETPAELGAAQLDAYLLGAHRLLQAVLPTMRRRSFGRVVLMSSSAATAAVPFHAFYSASKAALESYADALRYEVAPFGIAVSCVQGTGVRTAAATSARLAPADVTDYDPARVRVLDAFRRAQEDGPSPEVYARPIVAGIEGRHPRHRYYVGPRARALPVLRAVLPTPAFRALFARSFDL